MQIKGILSFPTLHQPKQVKDASGNPTGEAKYSCVLLIRPDDPQVAQIQNQVNTAIANTFPNGFPSKGDKCFMPYDEKYAGKEYYDPRFSGWYVFSCTAKADDKPALVNMDTTPVMDPAKVFSGAVVWVHAGISGYTKGTGGVGGWLNGVMVTDEEPPMGRLDNKPTAEQMFAGISQQQIAENQHATHIAASTGRPVTPPQGMVPPAPPTPPAPATLVMTAAANGVTYEAYKAANWTDDALIANGLAIKPSFG